MMNDQEKLKWIKDAIDDCRAGKLSEFATLLVICHVIDPQEISPEAKVWAKNQVDRQGG